jgi:hypothetical protein
MRKPMPKSRLLAALTVPALALSFLLVPVSAQTDNRPLVIVIEGRTLDTAAMTNIGPAGVSQLADIFRTLGARVQFTDLIAPIPREARAVVLIRPLRTVKPLQAAYLWAYLKQGGNLLLAVDPESFFIGTANARPRITRSGLSSLLDQDYSLLIRDSFLAEPWFSTQSIAGLDTAYSLTFPDVAQNPITQPLVQYGLPVWVWGARDIVAEPLGLGSPAVPLLYTDLAYGETDQAVFKTKNSDASDPLQLDIGADYMGRFNVGVSSENAETGTRIAVLGDSELLENGYGLVFDDLTPRYPGNLIFAKRLAAWLLELPEEQWPSLPAGFTWLAIDGSSSDWSGIQVFSVSDGSDAPSASDDIQMAQAFSDRDYVYLLIQTRAEPDPTSRIDITLDDGTQFLVQAHEVIVSEGSGAGTPVPDAAVAIGDAIEVRLPVRVVSTVGNLGKVCLVAGDSDTATPADCLDKPLPAPLVDSGAPYDAALYGHMLATVYTDHSIFLRAGPSEDTAEVATVVNGVTMAAVGRNEDGSWIQVQDARHTGWIAAFLLTPNGDLSQLPVVPSSAG